jgi:hypothetical protein
MDINSKISSHQAAHPPATAAGQYLGYSLQPTLLAIRLRKAAVGSACSLEVLDDIAEQAEVGTTHLIQSKSALTDNPVADRAVSLWKTLHNWLELAKLGLVNPDTTTFEIYVSRPVGGDLVERFHKASNDAEAAQALTSARDMLWGPAPDFSLKTKLAPKLHKYANTVLEADKTLIIPIIRNFSLTCGSGSPQTDFEKLIARDPISKHKVSFVVDKMLGWVKKQSDLLLEKGLPAVIMRDEFHREFTACVRSVDRDLILKSFLPKPTDDQKQERLDDLFVQQLDLIEEDYDEKLDAISNVLLAGWDRAIWSKSGEVYEESFEELNTSLHRTWRNLKKANDIENKTHPAVEKGKLLYYECMKHRTSVQQMNPPDHFVPGCFHLLADVLEIGWHPEYSVLLHDALEEAV